MPEYVPQYITIDDLSKGLNTYDPATRVPKGYYVDAQNMVLTNKAPKTVGGLTKLTTSPAPNNETIIWAEPYTNADLTVLVVATNAGTLYTYDPATDEWTTLLLGLDTDADVYNHVPFRGTLIFTNGLDEIKKFDGENVLPVGATLAFDFEEGEDWVGSFQYITDDTDLRREGLRAIQIKNGREASLTFTASQNLQTGINGAADFATTDHFRFWVYRDPTDLVGTVRVRFHDNTNVNTLYFEKEFSITTTGWSLQTTTIGGFTTVGATPTWNDIKEISIAVTDGQKFIVDMGYFQYDLSPPVGSLIELYSQQLVVAGIEADPVKLVYSDAGTPDYFDATSFARFSGGRHALEKTDQITALRSYFDELIVGKVNSAWTFSGTGTNVSISALPLTIGIDSHRGIAETPWSLQFPFEYNIFGARLTSRGLVSTNISSLLRALDGDELDKIVTIRHDGDHHIYWSFRTTAATNSQNDLGLIYDYQLDAWTSVFTPKISYYTKGIVNGAREVLVVQYDGYVRRMNTGTTFDGEAIDSYVTLPYQQTGTADHWGNVVRWIDATIYTRGTADVLVQARFADEPHEMDSATFATYGTVKATPDGDKGYVSFGITSRWIQVRLRALSGAFEVLPPVNIGYADTARRI
jgi:hypothetical protein